jgi:nitrogen-specific signal transduction histidine kinase
MTAAPDEADRGGLDDVRAMAREASHQVDRERVSSTSDARQAHAGSQHAVRNPYSGRRVPVQYIDARVDGPRDRPLRRLVVGAHSSYQLLAARLSAGWAVVSHRADRSPRPLLHPVHDDLGSGPKFLTHS